jgi:tetratricopeptide (TPR) repeat protein
MRIRVLSASWIVITVLSLATARTVSAQALRNDPRLEPSPEARFFAAALDVSDWRSLLSLAYWASGAPSWEASIRSFAPAVEELIKSAASLDERDAAEAVLEFMHRRFLKAYSERQTRFDTLLSSGRYNCVSSAVLYAVLGTAVGLEVSGIMTRDHAFCSVKLGGEEVDVETTNLYGFDPGTRIEFQDAFGKTTGFAYVPPGNYRDRTPIDRVTLFSLILSNRIADAESAKRFSEAVGLSVDRWVLLGSRPGPAFEDMIDRMLNYGSSLAMAGREEDALAWADKAIAVYGPHRKWEESVAAVANNLLVKLLRQGRVADARSRLTALKPSLAEASARSLDAVVSDAELVDALNAAQSGGDPGLFTSALDKAKDSGIISAARIREIEIVWRLGVIERIARAEGWAAGYAAADEAVAELGNDRRLEEYRRIYRANRIAEVYNAAASAYNAGRYAEARSLAIEALAEFPADSRLLALLSSAERALAAGR